MHVFDCVIVGAGIAGLSAAAELQAKGKSVRILEARDRIGGRIESIKVGDQMFESGGQWVAPGHDIMFELIDQYGLELVEDRNLDFLIRSQGKVVASHPAMTDNALSPFVVADLGQAMLRYRRLVSRNAKDPVWAEGNAAWLAQPVAKWAATNIRSIKAQEVFLDLLSETIGKPHADLTLAEALNESFANVDLETLYTVTGALGQKRIRGGMHQLTDKMAADLGDIIQLNCVVTKVTVADHVTIESADGESFEARTVLLTLPPWLAHALEFEPPMPSWRDEVVVKTSPGNAIKATVSYPKPWWRDHGWSGHASSDEGPVHVVFDVTDNDEGPGTMIGFFVGADAATMNGRSQALRERSFIDALAKIFGEEARGEHHYNDRLWGIEPFSEGCHGAHFSPGVWTRDGSQLAKPEGPIHFAGAEYANKHNGYQEGAIRSAREAAAAIIKQIG